MYSEPKVMSGSLTKSNVGCFAIPLSENGKEGMTDLQNKTKPIP